MRAGQLLQLVCLSLLSIGVVMVHSAETNLADLPTISDLFFSKHTLYALLAAGALFLASRINLAETLRVRHLLNPVLIIFLICLSLTAATWVPGVGVTINSASRWLRVGSGEMSFLFQPSELLKPATILLLAWWIARKGSLHRFVDGLLPALLLLIVTCVIVVKEDFGTAALIASAAVIVLVAGGAKIWHLAMLVPVAGAGLIGAIALKPHRIQRLMNYLDPYADHLDANFQITQAQVALAEGGLWGKGLGNGIQKLGYLPTDSSDMLLAVIGEELGLVGIVGVLLLYASLLGLGFYVAYRCRNRLGRMFALGMTSLITIQAVINLMVVTGLVPTKGIALPLISAGGTGWVTLAFSIGLIASLDFARAYEADQPVRTEPVNSPESAGDDEPDHDTVGALA